MESIDIERYIHACGSRARQAARLLASSTPEMRNAALMAMSNGLRLHEAEILKANGEDLAQAAALSPAMRDRLTLDHKRIELMASAVEQIAQQPEVLGTMEDACVRPNGLRVARMRIPLGVVAMIYEARPNVTSDAAALCLKSGNAVILKGGKEAFRSNMAIASILRNSLQESGLPTDALIFIETTDREAVNHLIHLRGDIDLLIPRGGEGLIRFVSENATVPVIQHYKGVCHIFVEKTADMAKTLPILLNAKCQRPGVCNAMETLLLDDGLSAADEANIIRTLIQNGVTLHVDDALFALYHGENVVEATEEDWPKEYLSLDLAVRRVHGLDEAIDHIARYSSNHTESILTEDASLAERFLHEVNSSTVLVNASTRFADGGELGLGAEIGISTSKLHAYGPMGCGELTTRKFVVRGEGQIRK